MAMNRNFETHKYITYIACAQGMLGSVGNWLWQNPRHLRNMICLQEFLFVTTLSLMTFRDVYCAQKKTISVPVWWVKQYQIVSTISKLIHSYWCILSSSHTVDYWILRKIDLFLEQPIDLQFQLMVSKQLTEDGYQSYEYAISKHIRNLSKFFIRNITYVVVIWNISCLVVWFIESN